MPTATGIRPSVGTQPRQAEKLFAWAPVSFWLTAPRVAYAFSTSLGRLFAGVARGLCSVVGCAESLQIGMGIVVVLDDVIGVCRVVRAASPVRQQGSAAVAVSLEDESAAVFPVRRKSVATVGAGPCFSHDNPLGCILRLLANQLLALMAGSEPTYSRVTTERLLQFSHISKCGFLYQEPANSASISLAVFVIHQTSLVAQNVLLPY